MTVIRTAIGKFAPGIHDAVARELADSEASLREAIAGLDGLIHFYAGIDAAAGHVANVSVWTTTEAAHQMDSLQAMLDDVRCLNRSG